MAVKEMLIVFVYDLEFCKNEADDPLKAIKYFHPSWVSDQQKVALCGQLMGMMNFCLNFEELNLISMQNGKFRIERFGRFILAMGTDRNIHESILTSRTELMINILKLYHNSINSIFEQFNNEPENFANKLYHIFETYLPIVQHNSNVLHNVYKQYLPKSASNLYLDATQILENVVTKPNVLGGMILYNNKVVSSQFSADLTKVLVATDPIRIKTTAEIAKNIDFHIPVGSQIIKVFISIQEYNRLQKRIKKVNESTSLGVQNPLPFSIRKKSKDSSSMMKRDKSLIFTHIPEEEALVEIPSPIEKARPNFNRPNHLPLKLKTLPPESGIASIVSFDESDSYPDFIGKTSVCCTPMTENKILTGPISSIFATTFEPTNEVKKNNNNDEIKSILKKPSERKWEKVFVAYANNPFSNNQWKKSFDDVSNILESSGEEMFRDYKVYNTITDPVYPILSEKRKPLSKVLFDDYQSASGVGEIAAKSTHVEEADPKVKEESKKKFDMDPMIMKKNDNSSPNRILRNQKKKMLKLPIKSFSLEIDSGKPSTSSTNNTTVFDSPSTKAKKYMGGLQLTPLMSKLTLLAMSENENFSSSFSTVDIPTTPNYYDTPVDNTNKSLFHRYSKVDEEKSEAINNVDVQLSDEMKRVDLFIIGQQNISLMILAEENLCNQQMVQQMFEITVNRLSRLEQKLNDVINVTVDLKTSDYSFVEFDKKWNVLQRGGSYDLQSTFLMHDTFKTKNLSDIIVRTNDSIIYGHNSGESEVYYQHAAKQQNGFPAPSEFTIISQAKRKLERDQSVVLF